jgi:hypothetical protein
MGAVIRALAAGLAFTCAQVGEGTGGFQRSNARVLPNACPPDPADSLCGPRCLYAMLRLSGKTVSLEQVSRAFGPCDGGCSLLELHDCASRFGMRTTVVRGGADSIGSLPLPAIVHVGEGRTMGHFLVLAEVDGSEYTVIDGTSGELAVQQGEFLRHWSGYALIATNGPARGLTLALSALLGAAAPLAVAAVHGKAVAMLATARRRARGGV